MPPCAASPARCARSSPAPTPPAPPPSPPPTSSPRSASRRSPRERTPMATAQTAATPAPTQDFMPLNGIDHVELWVGNAKQAAYFFTRAYGFTEVAYSGLETGV